MSAVKTKMTGTFKNALGSQQHTLSLEGDWKGKNFVVKLESGLEVACIRRSWIKHWGNHYKLTVAAGVDLALLSALTICLVASITEDEQDAVGGVANPVNLA
ncbi:hypothetical protein B9479_006982 [Cryptococcus floricola]|uniref:Tubby C-terminal domain-containing protein n=1 Tax=Cryptococcus floricola TaxID=2591691 RepID=A0A5D3ALK8_9TREE|nr:hypothetical protein B9479_006982 [Cryptococcus floricola]